MLIYALDAARLPAKRGAEIAPPPHDVMIHALRLDTSHNNSLEERVARFTGGRRGTGLGAVR